MNRVRCAQRVLYRSNALLPRQFLLQRPLTCDAAAVPQQRRTLHLLQHHHMKPRSSTPLAADEPPFVRYDDAEALQEQHRARFLSWKADAQGQRPQQQPPPLPQLITFQATPTYTLGRRQDELTPDQAERLTRPLTVELLESTRGNGGGSTSKSYTPLVKMTSRGGLTTYHGPGQLVFWPIIDMHSPLHARFGVASYARLLETTTQRLLADLFAIETYTNADEPGVWVTAADDNDSSMMQQQQPERKIAALGVHHRRYVTALGVALNIHLPVSGADERVNPWARFVPCGLEGRLVTSVAAEEETQGRRRRRRRAQVEQHARGGAVGEWDMDELAAQWAARFEEGLLGAGTS